jgi:hypothetical protein
MRLVDLVARYVCARNRDRPIGKPLAFKTCEHLMGAAQVYSRWLGRPATLDDLDAGPLNRFLAALVAGGASPYTARNRRTALVLLARYARRERLAHTTPARVRTIDCPSLATDGYTVDAMNQLLQYAAGLRGVVRGTGIAQRAWWNSFLRVEWDCGLRCGDMLGVECANFDPAGWLWARESKTGRCQWLALHRSTTAAVVAVLAATPPRRLIWPGWKRKHFFGAFRRLSTGAGVGGTSKFVRSGSSSEAERIKPGTGWQHLRHASPAVWQRHYRVAKIAAAGGPLPPELSLCPTPT